MSGSDWTRSEVELIVDDYLSMLASELAGASYNKTAHRRALKSHLADRSDQSIEFKHSNISAALLDSGFPYINGYKPRSNYQALLAEVVANRMSQSPELHEIAAADADRPMVVPEVDDILSVLTDRPRPIAERNRVAEPVVPLVRMTTNYIEREARNRSLGAAGELFVINYERARLIQVGREALAARIEHTSRIRGDHEGYDILSYDERGAERLIEVKTTKYGADTPFFVTRNEVGTSERRSSLYQVYRLYSFRASPRLYTLPGAISASCRLSAATFLASPA
ncbi:MAG: DUF3883 domain-containing protein [Telluria sp.]|nr:DUF3883 domain-containing protein [Telluria sp.]